MRTILEAGSPEVDRLLLAMGGAGRNRSVRTMVRETETLRGYGSEPLRRRERVITHRAAPGRIRIETIPADIARPGIEAAAGGTGTDRPGPRVVIVRPSKPHPSSDRSDPAIAPPESSLDPLRDARLEPRNLLAHIHERDALIRRGGGSGADIVIELSAERAAFRFDAATGLCTLRADFRRGVVTEYHDWRFVNGINTPFFELDTPLVRTSEGDEDLVGEVLDRFKPSDRATSTREGVGGERLERLLLAIAYDLPLPDALFEPIIVAT